MKRSRRIDLARMRRPVPALLGLAIASAALSGCGPDPRPVDLYQSLDECRQRTGREAQCTWLYQQAKERATTATPVYADMADCELEFGRNRCSTTIGPYSGQSVARPNMTGWIVDRQRRSGDCPEGYRPDIDQCVSASPAFRLDSGSGGGAHGGWYTPNGTRLPESGNGQVLADREAFSKVGGSVNTLRRGGFGQMAAEVAGRGSGGFHFGG